MNSVTPMMQEYIKVKRENPNIIVFYRLGDFYEMFFEDAITASHELELTLTGKSAGLKEKIPMCGVPHHAVSIYIEKLIEKGYKVGICEQMENPKLAKGLVKRELIQIVSKGAVFDNNSLNEKENNYIASIIDFEHIYSICYIDVSTGAIYALLLEHNNVKLINEIVSLNIKEVVINSKFDKSITSILRNQFKITISIYDIEELEDIYKETYIDITDVRLITSIKYLLSYINNTQKRSLSHLQKVIIKDNKSYLHMDIHTKRNLELTETIRTGERNYSLLWLLDKTKTAMGGRLLKNYIENPLTNIEEINRRYKIVETLLNEFILTGDLQNLLFEVYDLERLAGRVAFGNANGKDMIQLRNSLRVLPKIDIILKELNYYKNIDTITELLTILESSIYEEPPITLKEGYLIKSGFNAELDELKSLRKGGKDFVARFEAEEREKTGIKTLKVGYNRVFGYYIEVSKGLTKSVLPEYGYERRQTLSNCERYISPILKEKEALILNAEEKIIELEYNIFNEIREKTKEFIPNLQHTASIIAEIDVLQSFATISEQNRYIKPTITNKHEIKILDSRHPVVEKVLNKEFVANDILLDENTEIDLITGPNMAGKSTYMRQLAITVIMAQMGCFIPAKEATLPIFDAIYTRIGASDDLVSGESTFMVEMIEANNAIENATENSLVLFDELGRGTATFDGMALAQAIIEYIHNHIKCKTLFSTHYHELTDLDKNLKHLKNIHVSAYEENGNITFLHKIKEGSVDKSYGIHVAKLANMPDELIARASEILKVYEGNEKKRDIKVQEALPLEVKKDSIIEKEIKDLNILELTPLEALNLLYKLKERIK
ncbi:MAG: DNA mismatch repair protein MutS [Bacilli bacterium]|nr:DNA mismatch repair protein MutS [Bacilli bacterium]